jgi:hypothetical protein
MFITSTGVLSFAKDSPADVPAGQYAITHEGYYNRFHNYAKGYSLLIHKSMTVDMRLAGIVAVLENTYTRIQIFSQSLASVSGTSYRTYSNGFLKNNADHIWEYEGTQDIGGKTVHITQWYRNKLSRVANDKNYYIVLDIPVSGSEMMTIMISSSLPIYQSGGYAYLVEGLQFFERSAIGYVRKAADTNPNDRNWNEETRTFYEHYFSNTSPLTWGIFEPASPMLPNVLTELEQKLDYTFPIILNYTGIENTYMHSELDQRLASAYAAGKTLELTLQTMTLDPGSGNQIYRILNGEYDEFLANYAKTVAEFGHPVLFRVGNEMNGDWCPYSGYHLSRDPMVFVEFYKYVYEFFQRAGAKNVIWVWNPNGKSFPDFDWNNELMYYPGDSYVDIVGMTAYNTGNYYSGERWQTFAQLYDSLYFPYLEKYDKPLMITEFSCALQGGDKNQWVIDMFNHIKYYNRLKVAVWWNGADFDSNGNVARSYYINQPEFLIPTFRASLNGIPVIKPPADVSWKENVFA